MLLSGPLGWARQRRRARRQAQHPGLRRLLGPRPARARGRPGAGRPGRLRGGDRGPGRLAARADGGSAPAARLFRRREIDSHEPVL